MDAVKVQGLRLLKAVGLGKDANTMHSYLGWEQERKSLRDIFKGFPYRLSHYWGIYTMRLPVVRSYKLVYKPHYISWYNQVRRCYKSIILLGNGDPGPGPKIHRRSFSSLMRNITKPDPTWWTPVEVFLASCPHVTNRETWTISSPFQRP